MIVSNWLTSCEQNKVLLEQYEALTDELERRREECIQLRTILANVSSGAGGEGGLADSLGEMPEAEEVYAAYETQKSVIAQMQVFCNWFILFKNSQSHKKSVGFTDTVFSEKSRFSGQCCSDGTVLCK